MDPLPLLSFSGSKTIKKIIILLHLFATRHCNCILCTDTKDLLLFFFNEILQYFLKVGTYQVPTGSNMLVYMILNRDVQLGLQRFSIRAVELSRRASNSMGERKKKIKTLRTTIASERQNGHVA